MTEFEVQTLNRIEQKLDQVIAMLQQQPKTQPQRRQSSGDYPPAQHEGFVMPFGKHKDVSIADLPDKYLEWGVENFDRQDLADVFVVEMERRGLADGVMNSTPPPVPPPSQPQPPANPSPPGLF